MKIRLITSRVTFCLLASLILILAGCFQPVDIGETFIEEGTAYLRVTNESGDDAYVLESIELLNAEGEAEQSWKELDLAPGKTWEVHTEIEGTFTIIYGVKDLWISTSEVNEYNGGTVEIALNTANEFFFAAETLAESLMIRPRDSDDDGLPDAWEEENGFDSEDPGDGGTVYVKASGQDTNKGTKESPYLTLAKAVAKAGRGLKPEARTVVVEGQLTWANGGNDQLNKEYPGRADSVFYLGKTRSPITIRGEQSGTLTAEASGDKRVLYIDSGADITLRDITITGGRGVGGGIFSSGADLTLGSGTIVTGNNKNLADGMSGIEGGGIYMARGEMIMAGNSLVSDNEAYMCGGIKLFASTLTMKENSEIKGNKATYAIAGIRVENSTFTMIDNAKISGNTVGKPDDDIRRDVGGGATVIFGHIIMSGNSKITGNKNYNGWAGGVQVSGEGTLTMEDNSEISGNQCIVDDDVDVSNSSIGRGAGVFVDYGGKLYIKGGTITGNTAGYTAGGILVGVGASLNMTGGKITNNTATKGNGGGIALSGANTLFIMEDGEISGNTAAAGSGGGIFVNTGASLDMKGGKIINNTATAKSGGGIFLNYGDTSFNMTGGEISNNTAAAGYGGGVFFASDALANAYYSYIPGALFTMAGGEIAKNTAKQGGGIYVHAGARFTMTGGYVYGDSPADKGNTATEANGNPAGYSHALCIATRAQFNQSPLTYVPKADTITRFPIPDPSP
jgi:hypothetical protein